jgi:hypothetical protein
MKQLKVSLNGKQRGALERAAKDAGRSLSEEIRRRLADSLAQDRLLEFALVAGEDAMFLAQIVCASALGQRFEIPPDGRAGIVVQNEEGFELDDQAVKNLGHTVNRALVVALNEWFGKIKFEKPPEANSEADTLGRIAANSYSIVRSELIRMKAEHDEWKDDDS